MLLAVCNRRAAQSFAWLLLPTSLAAVVLRQSQLFAVQLPQCESVAALIMCGSPYMVSLISSCRSAPA